MQILSIIIILLLLIILPIIIIYIVLYIRNIKYNNIKGDTPPTPTPTPTPYSGYKYTLDLTKIGLNKYDIKVTFYNNNILFIDMNVYNGKNELIATNAFHSNRWTIVKDGYNIIYDPDLLKKIEDAPIKCVLDTHILYKKGTPNKIYASGSIQASIFPPVKMHVSIDQCSNTNCS